MDDTTGPLKDPARLDALRRSGVLDSPPEEAFDRLTRLAAKSLRVPVALVSLVDSDRQFFKSCVGTLPEPWHSRRQTPLSHSFCQHAVISGRPLVISDAREHPLVRDNGAIADLGVVAYAGVPLALSGGRVLGSFCVIDDKPRQWTDEELEILATLAAAAVGELELRLALCERQAAGEELRRSNDILRAVTEGTGDAVFEKDGAGRYVFVNPAAAAMAGKSPEEILGRDDTHVFDAPTGERVMAHDRRVMASGGVEELEGTYPLAGGERTLSSFKAPYRDAAGNVIGVIGIARDVTQRRRAEGELQQAKDQAEAASHAKDQFLAVLSHELRTPLAPVLALSSALERDAALPQSLRDDLGLIRRNVELQVRLIEDLLDLTRVSKGKLRLELESVDLHTLLRDTLRTCSSEDSVSKRLTLESDFTALAPFVRADPARLQQVFWNLLNNAIKFTPQGGRIVVRTRNEDPGGVGSASEGTPDRAAERTGRVVVEVADTGVGIDPEALPKIFDPFEQGADSTTRVFGGLGLGLTICKALVDAMGGRIGAHSAGRDRGATFRVELQPAACPVPDAPAAPAGVAADGPSHGPSHGGATPLTKPPAPLRILVVDDHVDTSKVMARLLSRNGYHVRTAGTLRAAVEAVVAGPVDLVISDVGLPDGSGHDLMRRLRESYGGVRGIALSGYGSDEDVRKSHDAGFDTHLTKPTDFDRLLDTIRDLSH
jgi:PAS domain S-box-containing protein